MLLLMLVLLQQTASSSANAPDHHRRGGAAATAASAARPGPREWITAAERVLVAAAAAIRPVVGPDAQADVDGYLLSGSVVVARRAPIWTATVVVFSCSRTA